jgi:regulator of RNase E activity RraB
MKEITIETIMKMLKDSDWRVRKAAMNACQGKDVPLEVIERGLKDSDCDVRKAAMNAYKINGIEVPVTRSFEPTTKVYKKCVGDVIVIAKIPKSAHVRGMVGKKCRASEAIIVDIIGELCGQQVGISKHNPKCVYEIGDHVVIDDFDFSEEECSTGYHFFCTEDEAKNY